jgi:hypothetical protein
LKTNPRKELLERALSRDHPKRCEKRKTAKKEKN